LANFDEQFFIAHQKTEPTMKTNECDRRQFLKTSLLGGTGAVLASSFIQTGCATAKASTLSGSVVRRKLGNTGIELPVVSFGVMRADNPALIPAAIKAGLVLFDTAHGYQRGRNEEMLGEVFKDYPRDSYVVATKVPPEEMDGRSGTIKAGSTSKAFLDRLDISLKRLKLDYVDILYVHGITSRDAALYPSMLEAVTQAKKDGKARHVGMSTHKNEPEVIQAAIDSGVYEVVLSAINFKQDYYQELKKTIAKAAKAGIGIVAMKTMAGGFHDRERQKPINCKAALKFVLQDENVTTAIPGITNFDQLAMNASVNTDITMNEQEKADVAPGKNVGSLYCQGCEHCVSGCPKGLPIPEIMRAYMYTYGYSNIEMAHSLLSSLNLPAKPCGECSVCTAQCVKGFRIGERIADVSRVLNVPTEFFA
jgi:predicted aldo/keto reductase-like oxidoreductase